MDHLLQTLIKLRESAPPRDDLDVTIWVTTDNTFIMTRIESLVLDGAIRLSGRSLAELGDVKNWETWTVQPQTHRGCVQLSIVNGNSSLEDLTRVAKCLEVYTLDVWHGWRLPEAKTIEPVKRPKRWPPLTPVPISQK